MGTFGHWALAVGSNHRQILSFFEISKMSGYVLLVVGLRRKKIKKNILCKKIQYTSWHYFEYA
jgi:hypothetical protein